MILYLAAADLSRKKEAASHIMTATPNANTVSEVASENIIPESEKNVKGKSEKFKAGNIGVAY